MYKMRYMPATHLLDAAEGHLLADLGERLRLARQRQGLTAQKVADKAGITRPTLSRLEHGEPAATLGTLIKVMSVLNLSQEFVLLARDERVGVQPAVQGREPQSVLHPATRPRRIALSKYPVLQGLAWHLTGGVTSVSPQEAFDLYERNWRHADLRLMTPAEQQLIDSLTRTVGKGVMLV